jgi:hypothetical protein
MAILVTRRSANLWPGRNGQKFLPAEKAILICVSPAKPFRSLGGWSAHAELGQAKFAVLIGIERGKLDCPRAGISRGDRYTSARRGLGKRRLRSTVLGGRKLAVKPEDSNHDSGEETRNSDGELQCYSIHVTRLIMRLLQQWILLRPEGVPCFQVKLFDRRDHG